MKFRYTVELFRDARLAKRVPVSADGDAEAAATFGPVKDGLGPEPKTGDWIRVTHDASGRTSWFLPG